MSQDSAHQTLANAVAKCYCLYCLAVFTEKSSLNRHIKNNICQRQVISPAHLELIKRDAEVSKRDAEISKRETEVTKKELEMIKQELEVAKQQLATALGLYGPLVYNQNLNVMCLGSNDSLLDMQDNREGLPLALTYLKDCVIAKLSGDCHLLQKAYQLETEQATIMYVNKTKNKYVYYDEKQRRMVEDKAEVMAKKLADIVQRSYLKGIECFNVGLSGQDKLWMTLHK